MARLHHSYALLLLTPLTRILPLFAQHLDGRPVETQSVAVDGAAHDVGALPTPVGCAPPERQRAELRVGDWVTARGRARVLFVSSFADCLFVHAALNVWIMNGGLIGLTSFSTSVAPAFFCFFGY